MDEVDRFYLGAVSGYSELRKAGAQPETVAVYVSRIFIDRIAMDLPRHPAAGFTTQDAGLKVPDKIAGLRIHVVEGQAEDFIVRV
jgi:hypothetical protein